MKIGILTGGGDCAGINSAIRGATFAAEELNHELYGIRWGWKGLLDFEEMQLSSKVVDFIGERSGTILGTSRTNPFKCEDGKDRSDVVLRNLKNYFDSLIAVGGEDTLGVAYKICNLGFPVIGVPKTMDYDLQCNSLGYDTAADNVREHLVKLQTTASSHGRVFVVEVFGRNRGHVAFKAGIAGMADVILIPEVPYDIDVVCQDVKRVYQKRERERTNPYAIVVVAEGAVSVAKDEETCESDKIDSFGHKKLGGISRMIASQIEVGLGYETELAPITYSARSGWCGCSDAFMGETLGRAAIYVAQEGESGIAVTGVKGNTIQIMSLKDVVVPKGVDVEAIPLYERRVSFGRPKQVYKPKIALT